jgi:hypothetical protein
MTWDRVIKTRDTISNWIKKITSRTKEITSRLRKNDLKRKILTSLIVELGFRQKLKPRPAGWTNSSAQPLGWALEPEETEPVTYKFLGFGQKLLSKPENWTEILAQPEDWIGSGCLTCSKSNLATTLIVTRSIWREVSFDDELYIYDKQAWNDVPR